MTSSEYGRAIEARLLQHIYLARQGGKHSKEARTLELVRATLAGEISVADWGPGY